MLIVKNILILDFMYLSSMYLRFLVCQSLAQIFLSHTQLFLWHCLLKNVSWVTFILKDKFLKIWISYKTQPSSMIIFCTHINVKLFLMYPCLYTLSSAQLTPNTQRATRPSILLLNWTYSFRLFPVLSHFCCSF